MTESEKGNGQSCERPQNGKYACWDLEHLRRELYRWADIFNTGLFGDQPVPRIHIALEKKRVTNYGSYVPANSTSTGREHININSANLRRPFWQILATLLHEMVHVWQHHSGNPSDSWYHNKEFQNRILSFGVLCDGTGSHSEIRNPFLSLLMERGVDLGLDHLSEGVVQIPTSPKPKGKSKLKRWSCSCTNVRVAVDDFRAVCLRCGRRFSRE